MKASQVAITQGLIKESTDLRDVDSIVSIIQAYSDCCISDTKGRNLDFKAARAVNGMDAIRIMSVATPHGYNDFDSSVLAEVVEYFGEGAEYTLARENSVCVYVKVHGRHWLNRKPRTFRVDEISVEDDGTFRLWWD